MSPLRKKSTKIVIIFIKLILDHFYVIILAIFIVVETSCQNAGSQGIKVQEYVAKLMMHTIKLQQEFETSTPYDPQPFADGLWYLFG